MLRLRLILIVNEPYAALNFTARFLSNLLLFILYIGPIHRESPIWPLLYAFSHSFLQVLLRVYSLQACYNLY